MEAILFFVDTFAILAVVFFALKNDGLREGAPQVGLFRIRDSAAAAPADPPPPGRQAAPSRTPGRQAAPSRTPGRQAAPSRTPERRAAPGRARR